MRAQGYCERLRFATTALQNTEFQSFREMRGSFADDAQFLDNRATQHLRFLKRLGIDAGYELGDVISSLDNIVEK